MNAPGSYPQAVALRYLARHAGGLSRPVPIEYTAAEDAFHGLSHEGVKHTRRCHDGALGANRYALLVGENSQFVGCSGSTPREGGVVVY